METFEKEINRRRTFAIISHPDAGKTTLTEKLLLYGGAILQAGAVKGKAADRHAVSDWMELEKQRGISITSSVMQFQYEGYCINIPIFTFINKLDREARDPFDLLDELEKEFGIGTYPMNWPIGCGKDFKGVYDRNKHAILAFSAKNRGQSKLDAIECDITDTDKLDAIIGEQAREELCEQIELLDGASFDFDIEKVRVGKLSPVFFGSALTNFGVEPFLENFLHMTTAPLPRKSENGVVDPLSGNFSAFVFKIQANMNKAHRDRLAFMRICSGKFERGTEYYHVQGGKNLKLSQPQQMMAQEREIVDEAYAGDIIGVFDPGIFSIGDTVCMPKNKVKYEGIPTFAPEHFAMVEQTDSMKRKQFVKGMNQIAQEGAIQIFFEPGGGMERVIVGVVGVLQFEVLEYRLKNEYGVDVRRSNLSYQHIRWIENENLNPATLNITSDTKWVQDFRGKNLLIFTSEWNIRWALEKNEGLELSEFSRN